MAQQLTKPQVRFPAVNGDPQQHITPGDGRAAITTAPEHPEPLLTSEGTKHIHDTRRHMQALKHIKQI